MNIQESRAAVAQLEIERKAHLKSYIFNYDSKLAKIYRECEHKWEYVPDPSGNNDSGYSCSGCGYWKKHID